MAAITWTVFFRGRAPATAPAHALALHVLIKQLLAPPGHGTGIEAEHSGDATVAAVAELEGLEPGVEPALAFVEQGAEQHDGSVQLVGNHAQPSANGMTSRR